jgi:ABC-2 type transport system ATP-binding protein
LKPVVEVVDVRKVFGRVEALRGVSLTVREGEIYGLVGPNGAGKTTLLRIIAGLLKPTSGLVRVSGLDPYKDFYRVRELLGYLPEDAGTYDYLTGYEHLLLYAKLYNLSSEAVEYGASLTQLGSRLYETTRGYSKGMKRRLLLSLVLMRRPRVALLDEPTAGLDVHASLSIRRAIRRYVEETGSTVIVSSHNMLEIEYLCDRVGLISRGRIVAEGSVDELLARYGAKNLEEVFEVVASGEAQ